MNTIQKAALLPYSAEEMYALVADIESYATFLPWCSGARIVARAADSITAAIDIDYHGVRKTFTTRNALQPGRLMTLELVDGPFKHLQGYWRFEPLAETGCKVSLDLKFEFSNRLLEFAAGPVFSSIANGLVDSFTQRALQIYGKRV